MRRPLFSRRQILTLGLAGGTLAAASTYLLLQPPPASEYMGIVATRCAIPHRQNRDARSVMSRTAHRATDRIESIRLLSGNWFVDEVVLGGEGGTYLERGTGHSQIRTATFEYPEGHYHRVTWGGETSVEEPDGAVDIVSDWIALPEPIEAGAWFFCNQFVSGNPAGIAYLTGVGNTEFDTSLGDRTRLDGVDSTAESFADGGDYTAAFGAASGFGLFPMGILGRTQRGSVLILGSSRTEGILDAADPTGDRGIIARSVGKSLNGYINGGVAGDSVSRLLASHQKRQSLGRYVSHLVLEGPTNDDLTSISLTASNIQNVLGLFPNLHRAVTTCNPQTLSDDEWASVENQQVIKDYLPVNELIMSRPGLIDTAFDIAKITASTVPGKWNADGTPRKWTADGIHETQFACQQIAQSGVIPASAFIR